MTYQEKLKSPKWQKKKNGILQRDEYKCKSCGNEERQLHVHHLFYLPNTDPWEYTDDALITYCDYCHNAAHLIGNKLQESLLDIIKQNRLLIRPLAQVCILLEERESFEDKLNEFVNNETIAHLKDKKNG